jgi:hypothetical protein
MVYQILINYSRPVLDHLSSDAVCEIIQGNFVLALLEVSIVQVTFELKIHGNQQI